MLLQKQFLSSPENNKVSHRLSDKFDIPQGSIHSNTSQKQDNMNQIKQFKTPQQFRREFFENFNNEDTIDDNMMVYMSVTKVKKIITEVLEPVLIQAKKESVFVNGVISRLDILDAAKQDMKGEIQILQRSTTVLNELQKAFWKFQADQGNHVQTVEGQQNTLRIQMETIKGEMGKINREHEADQLKIERLRKTQTQFESDMKNWQIQNQEALLMHNEEFVMKYQKLRQKIQKQEMELRQIDLDNDHIRDNTQNVSKQIQKMNIILEQVQVDDKDFDEYKLDKKIFEKQMEIFKQIVYSIQKRITQHENEMLILGRHATNYIPVMMQNKITESLANFQNSLGLSQLCKSLSDQSSVLSNLKSKNFTLINEIFVQKEEILENFKKLEIKANQAKDKAIIQEKEKIDIKKKQIQDVYDKIHNIQERNKEHENKQSGKNKEFKHQIEKTQKELKNIQKNNKKIDATQSLSPETIRKKTKKTIQENEYIESQKVITKQKSQNEDNQLQNKQNSQIIDQDQKEDSIQQNQEILLKKYKEQENEISEIQEYSIKEKLTHKSSSRKEKKEDKISVKNSFKVQKQISTKKNTNESKIDIQSQKIYYQGQSQQEILIELEQQSSQANDFQIKNHSQIEIQSFQAKVQMNSPRTNQNNKQNLISALGDQEKQFLTQQQVKEDNQIPSQSDQSQKSNNDNDILTIQKKQTADVVSQTKPGVNSNPQLLQMPLKPVQEESTKNQVSKDSSKSQDLGNSEQNISVQKDVIKQVQYTKDSYKQETRKESNNLLIQTKFIKNEESYQNIHQQQQDIQVQQKTREKSNEDDYGSQSSGNRFDIEEMYEHFYTKEQIDNFFVNKLIPLNDRDIKYGNQIRQVNKTVDQVKQILLDQIKNVESSFTLQMELKFKQTAEQIENTLKLNQRQKSDLQSMNMKLINKIEVLQKRVDELNESIESICTIILCLMESQCMQIRAEEQDDIDKQKISLMGQKSNTHGTYATNTEIIQQSNLDDHSELQAEKSFIGEQMKHNMDFIYQTVNIERSPNTARPHLSIIDNLKKIDFPEPLGQQTKRSTIQQKFNDIGLELSPRAIQLKEGRPRVKNVISIDPVCLSCTKLQSDLIKQFKFACLAYAPSPVIFRNMEFSRSQIIVFRKFLMGQSSKIVLLKEPFRSFQMSTKRIFDDMYIFLKEVNINYLKKVGQQNSIDEMNELPSQTHNEVTSQYWNLIYKSNKNGNNKQDEILSNILSSNQNKSKSINIVGIESEFNMSMMYGTGGATQDAQQINAKNPVLAHKKENNYTSRNTRDHHSVNSQRNSIFANRKASLQIATGDTPKAWIKNQNTNLVTIDDSQHSQEDLTNQVYGSKLEHQKVVNQSIITKINNQNPSFLSKQVQSQMVAHRPTVNRNNGVDDKFNNDINKDVMNIGYVQNIGSAVGITRGSIGLNNQMTAARNNLATAGIIQNRASGFRNKSNDRAIFNQNIPPLLSENANTQHLKMVNGSIRQALQIPLEKLTQGKNGEISVLGSSTFGKEISMIDAKNYLQKF